MKKDNLPVTTGKKDNLPATTDEKDNLPATTGTGIRDNVIRDNQICGDLVIGKSVKFFSEPSNPKALLNIIERSKQLSEEDQEYRDFLEELQGFLEPRPGRKIIGLKAKLEDGNRLDLLDEATYLENKFSRRVARDQLSRSAQAIYLHCLSKINSIFSLQILPIIKDGADKEIVTTAIYQLIVSPIYEEVSQADSSISMDLVQGMLFFLTAKCHMKWS